MNQKISNKITYLYFMLSFLILNLHSAYMDLFDSDSLVLSINQFIRIICNMSVPTFFFVSAMLFYRSCDNKKYANVIKSKIRTLAIPYLSWNIICFPLKEFKNIINSGVSPITSPLDVIHNVLMSQYDPVLWFIRVLFIYFLIYPLLLWIVKKGKAALFVAGAIFAINVYIGPVNGYSTCRYWLPIYLVGAYLGYWKKEQIFEKNCIRDWKKIITAVCLSILLCIWAYYIDLGMYICRMIMPLCYWTIADLFLTDAKPSWLTKQSFYFYSTQMIFSVVAQKVYILIFGKGTISAIISNVAIPLILLFILSVTAYLFHRMLPSVYDFLIGGRG